MVFIKVTLPGEESGYISTVEDAKKVIDSLAEEAEYYQDPETRYEFRAIEMTQEEFDNLPEFEGF